jgi:hypothetical protein
MQSRFLLFQTTVVIVNLSALMSALHAQSQRPRSFPEASVRFEQNATDGDVEVVFEIAGRDEGLTALKVIGPDGRTVVDFKSDKSTTGIRQFVFESPEPKDVERTKAAFPEGTYTFDGETASGEKLHGQASLSHKLPATTSFISPSPDQSGVSTKDVTITWAPVQGIANYLIEIEADEPDMSLTATLPASDASFSVPNGLLRPGTEYQLGIGTVSEDGNMSVVETHFTTAAE